MLPAKNRNRGQTLATECGKTGFVLRRWEDVSELTFFLILQVKNIFKNNSSIEIQFTPYNSSFKMYISVALVHLHSYASIA